MINSEFITAGKEGLLEAFQQAQTVAQGNSNMLAIGITIILALLICFFGLKITRILAVILGFVLGALIVGETVGSILNLTGTAKLALLIASGVLVAALAGFIYRFGVFLMAFLYGISIGQLFVAMNPTNVMIVIGVSVVLAIVTAIFAEPLTIVMTSIFGGINGGRGIVLAAGLMSPSWAYILIGAVLALMGMAVQFMMHSKKIGKKERVFSQKVKEKESVEAEVDQARTLLTDDEDS